MGQACLTSTGTALTAAGQGLYQGAAASASMAYQAGAAVANTSPVQALTSAAVNLGTTLAPPAALTAAANVNLLWAKPDPDAAEVRTNLQTALTDLGGLPAGASPEQTRMAQDIAHAALIRYGETTSNRLDRLLPVVHKASLVGVAGAGMAFGAGRSSGIAAADAALRDARDQSPAPGIYAPQPSSGGQRPTGPAPTNGTTNGTLPSPPPVGGNDTLASPPPLAGNGTTNGTLASPPPLAGNSTTNSTLASPPPLAGNGTANSTTNGTSSGPGRLLMAANATTPSNTSVPAGPGANGTSPSATLSPPGANTTSANTTLSAPASSNASTSTAAGPGNVASTSTPSILDSAANAAAQTVMGAALGGVGNFVGQTMVAPLVNRIPRQSAPVDVSAVVPNEMVTLMNQIQPGSGTELREAAAAEQRLNANPNSARNVRVGQAFFDGANGLKAYMQGSDTLGGGGTLLVGTTVSTLAGSAIGATMAINASLSTLSVPNMDSLRRQADLGAQGRLENVTRQDVPLFFAKHMGDNVPPLFTFANPVVDPSGSGLQTALNVATSIGQRAGEMLAATTWTGAISAVAPAVVAATPEPLQDIARAAMAATGIHQAIEPWFNSLTPGAAPGLAANAPPTGIAANDAGILAGRQSAIDAAQQAAQNVAAAAGDVELGPRPQAGLRQRIPHNAQP
jgi:hypothetical protein